jgi:AP-3 complex subunit beta
MIIIIFIYDNNYILSALTKIYALDMEQLPHLKQIMSLLLKDSQTMVLGSVIASFNEICPTSYEIIHKAYRKLCHLLADLDEWTQIITLEVMCRYIRDQFLDPAPGVSAAVRLQVKQRSTSASKGSVIGNTIKRKIVRKAFYSDEEDELNEEEIELEVGGSVTGTAVLRYACCISGC